MATLSVEDVSQPERDNAAADLPMLCGQSKAALAYEDEASWDINWTDTAGGTARNLTTHPASWAADGYHHKPTKPDIGTVTPTVWYLDIDLGAALEFDTVAILGHNFAAAGVTAVEFGVCDAGFTAFTSLTTFGGGAPTGTRRLVELVLKDTGSNARRYTQRYLELKLTGPASFQPEIGELFIGRRRQLAHHPNLPHDPDRSVPGRVMRETRSGVLSPYIHHWGGFELPAAWNIGDTTTIQALLDFWTDSQGGNKTGLWVPKPNSAPANAYAMLSADGGLNAPYVDYQERQVAIHLREQGDLFVARETDS